MLGAKAIARAKINLFLGVGPLRDDGYHDLKSVMQSLELADELYFRRSDGSTGGVSIRCNETKVPRGEDNLVCRAVEAFQKSAGLGFEGGIEVLINKKIPVAAGLGGGSSDAAATLLALNHIFETEFSLETLQKIGAGVGSDVPFCVTGGTAVVTGRGEVIRPLNPLPPLHVVLASCGEEVSTREVYSRFDELGAPGEPGEIEEKLGSFMDGVSNHDFESLFSNLYNNLEITAGMRLHVEEYKETAREAGARAALMSGSGPMVFALVSGMEEAAEVAWELEKSAPVTILTSFADKGAEVQVSP